jgi:hypothetical protein
VLHVVRDGRDMAFSHNRAPLVKYAPFLTLNLPPAPPAATAPETSCAAWAAQNLAAAAWGARWNRARSGGLPVSSSRNSGRPPQQYRWLRIEDFNASDPAGAHAWAAAVVEVGGARGFDEAAVRAAMAALNGKSLGSHDPAVQRAAAEAARGAAETAGAGGGGGGAAAAFAIVPPPSVGGYGKWRALADPATQRKLQAIARDALLLFGYLEP